VLALHRSAHGYELQTATGELVAAKSMVVAVGISHFRHLPRRLAHLPRELVSHTSHQRSLGAFSGRDVTVIGGGQSALETAALAREQGANVRVLVRQPRLVWNDLPQQEPRPPAQRLRRPTTGLGDGWRMRFYANSPGTFHRLPERMRVRAVRTALGPAGAWWLKERVLGQLPVLTGHTVVGAEAAGNRLRLRVRRDDGRVVHHTTEHLIAGTGYRVDLGRLPFLDDQLRGRLRLVAGAPALSSSFEASGSGPVLRRVGVRAQLRADHAVPPRRELQRPPPRQSPPGQGRRGAIPGAGRAGDPWRHLVNMPDGAEGRALLTIGRSRPSWRAGACNANAGPIVLTVGIPHPPISPLTPLSGARDVPVQPPRSSRRTLR
jgi:hypothetical protein